MHYVEQYGCIFLLHFVAHFTNLHQCSFYCFYTGEVRAPQSEVKMEMLIFFFPSRVMLWPPGNSFKNSFSFPVPLLLQIQYPSWLSWTEISHLYSRAVLLSTSCFYVSHCGKRPFELLMFTKSSFLLKYNRHTLY